MNDKGSDKTTESDTMPGSAVEPLSELAEACWSVISFERVEISGQTYEQAERRMADLDQQRVPGLCIITDKAAARAHA